MGSNSGQIGALPCEVPCVAWGGSSEREGNQPDNSLDLQVGEESVHLPESNTGNFAKMHQT